MKLLVLLSIFLNLAFGVNLSSKDEDVSKDNTVLIFGGIQGDEPGGYLAANLLLNNYKITKGKIIVIPNLAFESILKNTRGQNGDLNRKFAYIAKNDPDYELIEKIKGLILLPEVSMVINLHDGFGFYNPLYINSLQNPRRWGNSSVIDTKVITSSKYSNLEQIASKVVENINANLLDERHAYHLKNTKTKELNDKEMLKALTFFAISHNKAAFANEASKNLSISSRVYYHLLALESYLKIAQIDFQRQFTLNLKEIEKLINKDISLRLYSKILLITNKKRKRISYVPVDINKPLSYVSDNLLSAIDDDLNFRYASLYAVKLRPEFFEFSNILDQVNIIVDDKTITTPFASLIKVKNSFLIPKIQGVRVNIIGLDKKGDESSILVRQKDLNKAYALDLDKIYRVEFYEQRPFKQANLKQEIKDSNSTQIPLSKLKITPKDLAKAKTKDKFIGSILISW